MGIKRRRDDGNYADHGPKYTSYKGSTAWIFNEVALEAERVIICEGEIDCMTLAQVGIAAICSTAGVGHFPAEWQKLLAGKDVVIWFDTDENGVGQRAALLLAIDLDAAGIAVRIVGQQPKKDVNEVLG